MTTAYELSPAKQNIKIIDEQIIGNQLVHIYR